MRWTALALCLLAAGCGPAPRERPAAPIPEPAEPRHAALRWVENYGDGEQQLRFEVSTLDVRDGGWTAHVALENRTGTLFELGSRPLALAFGLMVLADGSAESFEQLNRSGALPAIRRAATIEPPPPEALSPAERWEATLSAPGSLPAGSWLRVTFGTLFAQGDPPEGLEPRIVWITDSAYPL